MIIKLVISYVLTLLLFLIIDLVWLGVLAKNIYQKQLGHYLSPEVKWVAAVIFYMLYVVGIFIFAIQPAIIAEDWNKALYLGALFGFFAYATYELTNYALIKDWPLPIVFIDIVWGVVLTASVSTGGYFITKYIQSLEF